MQAAIIAIIAMHQRPMALETYGIGQAGVNQAQQIPSSINKRGTRWLVTNYDESLRFNQK